MKNKILVIHGPNLHLLGKREPEIYGNFTLDDINNSLHENISSEEFDIEIFQSNSEGDIVEKITKTSYDFLIINPAAYTHTSVAIRDALLGINKPTIEVHISNIFKREEFRKKSMISDVVLGVISGLGKHSYLLGLEAAMISLRKNK
ncbi:MAG: type II 3-dehydroquinate dehydratase [Candidatus Omnitrophica bacterium]|nr:type II 3-dehydroquinate dehydratase [Candidatus Omnitrophota bacterium]MCK5288700.1 type II 3-dehydroquinate dehydratase [Candidatus Omnitrophota bacterium]MCK5491492.1 type II 3-dehydroquinate dehydratase [Candidatus Omnitrophota bacterium]